MQVYAQVRLKDSTPGVPPDLAGSMTPVTVDGTLEDWVPSLEYVIERGDAIDLDDLADRWAQFRRRYVVEYGLGRRGCIRAMVETAHYTSDLPMYIPVLESLMGEYGDLTPVEAERLISELGIVREELSQKSEYAGWELLGERTGQKRVVGWGLWPFENEVLASASGWMVVLRRDDKAILTRPGGEERSIRGWQMQLEAAPNGGPEVGEVTCLSEEGDRIRIPRELAQELLLVSGGATRVEVRRSNLVSVYAKVWAGLNEAAHVGVERSRPVWVRTRNPGVGVGGSVLRGGGFVEEK